MKLTERSSSASSQHLAITHKHTARESIRARCKHSQDKMDDLPVEQQFSQFSRG